MKEIFSANLSVVTTVTLRVSAVCQRFGGSQLDGDGMEKVQLRIIFLKGEADVYTKSGASLMNQEFSMRKSTGRII